MKIVECVMKIKKAKKKQKKNKQQQQQTNALLQSNSKCRMVRNYYCSE